MAICGIYGFLQISTGMWYIGQSIDIERREQEHRASIAQDWHKLLLTNPNDFHFTILEECSPESLDERENYYIDLYKSFEHGFNSTRGNHVKSKVKLDTSDFHILFDDGEDEQEIARIIRAIRTKTFKDTILKIINKDNYEEASPIYWLRKKFHDNCYLIQVLYFNKDHSKRENDRFIYLNLENYINKERDKELEDIIKEDKIWWEDNIASSNKYFYAWYYIARKGNSYTCNKYFQINKQNFYISSIKILDPLFSLQDIQREAELQRIDCHFYW